MNIGLYTGTIGVLLPRLLEYKLVKSEDRQKDISFLLDVVYEGFGNVNTLGFKNGITGIGWGLEWCAQHQLLRINSDDILADIDDLLYRDTVYGSFNEHSLFELVWRANYFYRRGISKNKHQNRYRHLCHRECLFLVLEDIERKRIMEGHGMFADDIEELRFLSLYFLLLSRVFMLKDQAIETAYYDMAQHIQEKLVLHLLEKQDSHEPTLLYALATLAEIFVIASRNTRHYYWACQGEEFSQALKDKIGLLDTDKHDRLSELIIKALHYINVQNEETKESLQEALVGIPYDSLSDTFYKGKGIVDTVRVIIRLPKYTTDIVDLLLL